MVMNLAGELNLYINQGETFFQNFQWTFENGAPVNLTGHIGRCQIRNGAGNQGILKTVPVVIIDAENGLFYVSLSAVETSDIPASGIHFNEMDEYDYDVEFESNGVVNRILNGKIFISPEVTR